MTKKKKKVTVPFYELEKNKDQKQSHHNDSENTDESDAPVSFCNHVSLRFGYVSNLTFNTQISSKTKYQVCGPYTNVCVCFIVASLIF